MLNQGRFFIEVANLAMPRVLSRSLAARKSTPIVWEKLPESGDTFFNIRDIFRYMLVCFIINYKKDNTTNVVSPSLDYCMHVLSFLLKEDRNFLRRMRVFLKTRTPTAESIFEHLRGIVCGILQKKGMEHVFGVNIHDNFSKDYKLFHTDTVDFQNFFDSVWYEMYPSLEIQILESEAFYANQHIEMLIKSAGMPCANQSPAAIVARTAVTFTTDPQPVVPTLVSGAPQSAPPLLDESVKIVRVLPDPPERNDTTDLFLHAVKGYLKDCVNEAVNTAAVAFFEGNRSTVMEITGAELDARVLATEVTGDATQNAIAAVSTAIAASEVVEAVKAAADAGESLSQDHAPHALDLGSLGKSVESRPFHPPVSIVDIPLDSGTNSPASSATQLSADAIPGDAKSAAKSAAINSPIKPLPGQPQNPPCFCANGDGDPLSVISEEKDGADQSGNSSPLPVGEGRAHLTTSAQSPQQCVEDRALRAHPKSPLSNLGSNPSSGLNGTFPIHELSYLLANLPILSLSSSTPAHPKLPSSFLELTSKGVSPLAQSSDNLSGILPYLPPPELLKMLDEPPPLPTQSSSSRGHNIGVGGAHSSNIQSKNARSTVGMRWNPRADQPSFSPQGCGGPPVQVLASSGKPPGSFGGADHPKTPPRLNFWSSCIPGRKTSSASQSDNSSSSGHNIFRRHKSNHGNPVPGQTNDTSLSVAHSSDKNPSESDAPPSLPPSSFPLGDSIGVSPTAHSPGDPPGFVSPPAPSPSSELGDVAPNSAASLNEKPPTTKWGVKIGGIEREGVGSQFVEVASLVLMMKYTTAQPSLPPLWTHPCVPEVPNLLALQARVA
jgi:hypothetical protein